MKIWFAFILLAVAGITHASYQPHLMEGQCVVIKDGMAVHNSPCQYGYRDDSYLFAGFEAQTDLSLFTIKVSDDNGRTTHLFNGEPRPAFYRHPKTLALLDNKTDDAYICTPLDDKREFCFMHKNF